MKKTVLLVIATLFCFATAKAQDVVADNQNATGEKSAMVDASFRTESANAYANMSEEERMERINQFMAQNRKLFNRRDYGKIMDMLEGLNERRLNTVLLYAEEDFKDPRMMLAVSIVAPILTFNILSGIDRLLIEDTGLGILKTLTWGGLWIWTIVDWFTIQKRTRKHNFEILKEHCGVYDRY